jgi:hypothetical protein
MIKSAGGEGLQTIGAQVRAAHMVIILMVIVWGWGKKDTRVNIISSMPNATKICGKRRSGDESDPGLIGTI